MTDLVSFVRESNRIEGIRREPTQEEVDAHAVLLSLPELKRADIEAFVAIIAPGKPIRDRVGMNVTVGNHRPPPGGRTILVDLHHILGRANKRHSPFKVHQAYETLHPFMDGNGRSGRAIWLWMMLKIGHDPHVLQRGFLHTWYYQSLSASR